MVRRRGHEHNELWRCVTNCHCRDQRVSVQGFVGQTRSARSTRARIRLMVVGQSSSSWRTQPTMQRFIRRSVEEMRLISATFSGRTCMAKRAVGLTTASKSWSRDLRLIFRLVSHRRNLLNLYHAARSLLSNSVLTREAGSRLSIFRDTDAPLTAVKSL